MRGTVSVDQGVTAALEAFAASVGPDAPVCAVGGRTQWAVSGLPQPGVLEVTAPSGVVSHEPAEMVVRVGAATPLAELQEAVAASGQWVPLEADAPEQATVGGLLSVGRSGVRRLRYGPIRDVLLEARYVDASGQLVRTGAPLVKNVTGYDLCRLLVGSLGTLGLLGEVVVRCLPAPPARRWWTSATGADPFGLLGALYRPAAVLWDGDRIWVGLDGEVAEVADQAARVLAGWEEVAGPPSVDGLPHRRSVPPGALRALSAVPGRWLAEVGVGVIRTSDDAVAAIDGAVARPTAPERVRALNQAVKQRFDPTGRLNPGREVMS